MSIRLERERIWWMINGSINQLNAFLGSNPWPCPNGYTPTLSIVEPEKAVAFDHMRLKSKLILTLGEFLATSVSLLIALLGGADTALKIYFKNSHESKVFSKECWIDINNLTKNCKMANVSTFNNFSINCPQIRFCDKKAITVEEDLYLYFMKNTGIITYTQKILRSTVESDNILTSFLNRMQLCWKDGTANIS